MTTQRKSKSPGKKRGPRKSKPDLGKALARVTSAPAESRAARPRVAISPGAKWTAAAFAALLVVGALWLMIYPSGKGPGQGSVVEFVVEGDETASVMADKLGTAGLVTSPRMFAIYLWATGGTSAMIKGMHILGDDATPGEIIARLERRPGAGHVKVTFPEGWTRFDMAKRLQEKRVATLRSFLEATTNADLLKELRIDGETAEGFLFPSTYDLAPDSDAAEIVRRMKAEFDRRYVTIEQKYESGILDLSHEPLKFGTREIITLASMVEKEAAVDDERPIIASVFLNRLRDADFKPKILQCDPTAGYGCLVQPDLASCASYAGKITPAVNGDPANRYTTYKHEGLPPGPISNPGAKSIAAVMNAANTRFFYFVAKGEGRHTFSETYAAHAQAVGKKP